MTIVTDLIEDLKTELMVLNRYSASVQIQLDKIKPLWWTDKYDGRYLAGFCEFNNEMFRFSIVYSDLSSDINVYILQKPTQDQLKIELERITDWESMVGLNRTFVGELNNWKIKDINVNNSGSEKFYNKYFDEKRTVFKTKLDYMDNLSEFVFEL